MPQCPKYQQTFLPELVSGFLWPLSLSPQADVCWERACSGKFQLLPSPGGWRRAKVGTLRRKVERHSWGVCARPAARSNQNRASYLALNGKDLRTNLRAISPLCLSPLLLCALSSTLACLLLSQCFSFIYIYIYICSQ